MGEQSDSDFVPITVKNVVRLYDIQNVKDKFERALTTRRLAKELGVDCQVIEELAQAGYLQTRWRPAVDGYNTIKFDRDSVQQLLNSGLIPNSVGKNPVAPVPSKGVLLS